ncbi:1-phosphofructokinase family hexose kinase [Limibacillus sp. MBR-115]|uniref:1-phosphofructokinase family hexose kinase n=1 Tax=Limibacillus sp. MBR-115 TaxID=3156465 RepID=UPI00339760D1
MTAILTVTVNPTVDLSSEVETLRPHSKLRCEPLCREPGGGGINVARVCQRLGAPATAVYTAGGATGAILHDLLMGESLDGEAVSITGETRESFTIFEQSSQRQYRFLFPGPNVSEEEGAALLSVIENCEPVPAYVVASGSIALGLGEDFFARLCALSNTLGARFVLDTHGPALRRAVAAGGIDILKVNLRELRELTGLSLERESDQLEAARGLVADGSCRVLTLTLGDRGAYVTSPEGSFRAQGLTIKTVSAVGAGDSFLGGFLSRLSRGDSLKEAFRWGVAAGSAALLTPGTQLCEADAVNELLSAVKVVPVSLPA